MPPHPEGRWIAGIPDSRSRLTDRIDNVLQAAGIKTYKRGCPLSSSLSEVESGNDLRKEGTMYCLFPLGLPEHALPAKCNTRSLIPVTDEPRHEAALPRVNGTSYFFFAAGFFAAGFFAAGFFATAFFAAGFFAAGFFATAFFAAGFFAAGFFTAAFAIIHSSSLSENNDILTSVLRKLQYT